MLRGLVATVECHPAGCLSVCSVSDSKQQLLVCLPFVTATVGDRITSPSSISCCALVKSVGWGRSSFGRASCWHAAIAGSIPWCSKGFFSQSQLSVQTLLQCLYNPMCNCIYICAHVNDPVVHIRLWWIMETPACTIGWVM